MNATICIVTAILICCSGCDVFTTREPEPPNQTRSNFTPPTSPDIVLDNLKSAIAERNTDNYVRCFADPTLSSRTFVFTPTQDAQSQFLSIFRNWDVNAERDYFENVKARTPTEASSSLFLTGNFQSIQSDSAIYNADYLLNFQHASAGISQQAKGKLQFFLSPNSKSEWAIHRWVDIKVGSEFSWSEFKARFSN
jgi:hypothetical protein